jgi:N-acyl-phosphatidylethanolamine-hydrolysing phospholipase D
MKSSPYPSNQPYDPIRKRFINPHIKDEKRTIKDALLWKLGYFDDRKEESRLPFQFQYPIPQDPLDPCHPFAIWVNHSTFFIQVDGLHFLTDPIWGRRCSPVDFLGPVRKHPPALELHNLKKVDHVLISHNHYDHLDRRTVLALHKFYPNIQWWVPLGVKKWFLRLGITQVQELGWWESLSHNGIHFTAVPTQHFSGRTLKDTWKTLWLGWVVETQSKRFYFVGDTGYNPFDFKSIGKKWPYMDLSLIPIGSYLPKKFMSPVHIDPFHAVQIHQEVSSKQSIGMHWCTFKLSDEDAFRPPYDLFLALQEQKIDPRSFLAIPPGHGINW